MHMFKKRMPMNVVLYYALFCLCTTCSLTYADSDWDLKFDSAIELRNKGQYTEAIPVIKNGLELLKNDKLNGDLTYSKSI